MTAIQAALIRVACYNGDRVIVNGKTIWKGLGNRAGLHSYEITALATQWRKSNKKFLARVAALQKGDTVEVQSFRNITRDHGKWVRRGAGTIGQAFMWMF